VRIHGANELRSGGSELAHLRLEGPAVNFAGRSFYRTTVLASRDIGGGIVLDNLGRGPRQKMRNECNFSKHLKNGISRRGCTAMAVRAPFGLSQEEIAARTGWTDSVIQAVTRKEEERGRLKIVSQPQLFVVEQEIVR